MFDNQCSYGVSDNTYAYCTMYRYTSSTYLLCYMTQVLITLTGDWLVYSND